MKKKRYKGDKYRPVVNVLKAKNGIPTKISISDKVYNLNFGEPIAVRKTKKELGQ